MTKEQAKAEVYRQAVSYGVDPALAMAVAHTESSFNPSARGAAGEIGVMQLMPGTAAEVGVDPTIPSEGIRGGVIYLSRMLALSGGDAYGALWAYNAGPGNKTKGILPSSTRSYIDLVLSRIPLYRGYMPAIAPGWPTIDDSQSPAPSVSNGDGSWLPGTVDGQSGTFSGPDLESIGLYAGIGLGLLGVLWLVSIRD